MGTILPPLGKFRIKTHRRKHGKPETPTEEDKSRLDEILKKNRLENYTTHHLSPNSLFNYNKNYKTD